MLCPFKGRGGHCLKNGTVRLCNNAIKKANDSLNKDIISTTLLFLMAIKL